MAVNSGSRENNLEYKELRIPVPWGVIAAKCYGDSHLPPILMVHGIQDNAGTFDRLMPFLPDSFYYVNIDLPGHGKSSAFPKGVILDIMLYVSALRRAVIHFQWTKYYYVGHSLGGQIGTYYTALYREEVTKFAIIDTLTQMLVSVEGYLNIYKDKIKRLIELENKVYNRDPPNYTVEEALRRMIDHRPSPIKKEAAEVLMKRSLKENENKKNFFHFSTDQRLKLGVSTPMSPEQHLHIVSTIECPILLIITNILLNYVENRKDWAYNTLKIYQSKSNCQIVEVNGYHDVHNNEPEIVGPILSKFLLQPKSVL